MSTKNQALAMDPEGEIGRTGTRVSLFLPLSVILSSLHVISRVATFVIMVVAMVVVMGMLVRRLVIMRHYNLPTSSCPSGLTRTLISAAYLFRYW